jgi:hypothetical protein
MGMTRLERNSGRYHVDVMRRDASEGDAFPGRDPLAQGAESRYSFDMRFEIARRLLVLLLSVALATGFTVRVVQADSMNMTAAAMATSDMPMPGKCDGCLGNEKATASACFVHCSGITALPAVMTAFDPPPAGVVAPAVAPAAAVMRLTTAT